MAREFDLARHRAQALEELGEALASGPEASAVLAALRSADEHALALYGLAGIPAIAAIRIMARHRDCATPVWDQSLCA